MPTLFISHGSPMLAIEDTPARVFLQGLGETLPRPRAIIVFSAHWESIGGPAVSLATQPETIHDFGGFPDALYAIQYPATGAPAVAMQAASLLEQAGYTVRRSDTRGLDHGAWVPLRLMYPAADVPVTQISLLRDASPEEHEKLGRTLSSLRDEGVLVIGSGSLSHNLSEFRGHHIDAEVPAWVNEFSDWMNAALSEGRRADVLDYRRKAPHAVRNHPTEEHLLPLFVAMGAGGAGPSGEGVQTQRIHSSVEYGVLAMDVYAFS
ncbi:MAG TPA: class III extradiol ring-cleavage dioxygenase [Noviherbaspirillum sp.]|nr:class III extradiol ring-cleavage dioxygenase [Noviherbaspirillum sp.]